MRANKAPSRANANVAHNNNAQIHANNAQTHANTTNSRRRREPIRPRRTPGPTPLKSLVNGTAVGTNPASSANPSLGTYRYGTGNNARHYQASGYGRGYRNHYSAGRSGYGRSQSNTRGIVSRLRSVHRSLAQIDHDYRGHRVQAMHSISAAIRQLSHRSMSSNMNGMIERPEQRLLGMNGDATGTNTTGRTGVNGLNGNARNNGLNGNRGVNGLNGNRGANGLNGNLGANGGRGNQRLTQFQSDARMAQALRTTQGIAMQMGNQGTYSGGRHARAPGPSPSGYASHEHRPGRPLKGD